MPAEQFHDTAPNWAAAPRMDSAGFHDEGGQSWRYDQTGVFLQAAPNTPVRSRGEPATVRAILANYGNEIFDASMAHGIPPELIIMTIATETAMFRPVNFTGPKTFRWEPSQGSYSGGPMQVLETTAHDIINRLGLSFAPEDIPRHFPAKPAAPPALNPLYDGDVCIPLGTGYIRMKRERTGLDPILLAATYNHGSIGRTVPTQDNPWGLITAGDHLNRSAAWFGDACAVLATLRQGQALDVGDVIAGPATIDPDDQAEDEFEIPNLAPDIADQEKAEYEASGATVIKIPEEGGFFTLVVTYDKPTAPPPPPPPQAGLRVQPPDQDGYVICLDRKESQLRPGKGFARTVGLYQAFFNRQPISDVFGMAVERQGPGDNTDTGVARHARLTAKIYPLFTHAGGRNKYRTFGFANPGGIKTRPWPSIRIGDTGSRSGVLIHCAAGYLMSIGCINLTGRVITKPGDDLEFSDSRARVIQLIQSMKERLGSQFPTGNNMRIPNAHLLIRGEP